MAYLGLTEEQKFDLHFNRKPIVNRYRMFRAVPLVLGIAYLSAMVYAFHGIAKTASPNDTAPKTPQVSPLGYSKPFLPISNSRNVMTAQVGGLEKGVEFK